MRITILKDRRGSDTMRIMTIEELARMICQGDYAEAVETFREEYPLMRYKLRDDKGELQGYANWPKDLPRICFALEQTKRKGERITLAYTGLVMIEVNNLTGLDEAEAVRRGAAEMPQTLLAFVGAEGMSVKIVCRGELFPKDRMSEEGQDKAINTGLPQEPSQVALFHENLYERARLIYNGQLGVTIEKLEPQTERVCYISHDEELWYNPMATPIYARAEKPTEMMLHRQATGAEEDMAAERHISMYQLIEHNMAKAYDDTEGITNDEARMHAVLSRTARYCMETGVDQAVAELQMMQKMPFCRQRELVKLVFTNTYHDEHMLRYMDKRGIQREKTIPASTLMTMKLGIFLDTHYDFRMNVMRGVAEFRQRTGIGFAFRDLTDQARNSITRRAQEQGIPCWDKDIRRYVESEDIPRYAPINDYLEHLPRWDGNDRVTPLALRVPTEWSEWPHLFHIWMRSMVAMWQGKGQLTGNALVPLLIGRQGCGKSSFCRILLPREMSDYYNDRINFKNDSDLNLGLSSFALINLDEFDSVTQRQQVVLKYLVSTADLKYRPPYGKAYTIGRRYASFIGTTNEQHPLTDPTGSRRFVCVPINGDIDFHTTVDHRQLYAQLVYEVAHGAQYWLSKDEEQALMQHNLEYQRISGLGEMLMSIIRKPQPNEQGTWMSLKELSAIMKKRFRGFKDEPGVFIKMGNYLSRPEHKFDSKRTNAGYLYHVILRAE